MDLNEENLRKIVKGIPVGSFSPFIDADYQGANNYALKLSKKLQENKVLAVEQERESYGCGYASYYDLFITKKDGSLCLQRGDSIDMQGIRLYISRLAPVAVLGYAEKSKHISGGSSSFLDSSGVNTFPDANWELELTEIRNTLNIYRYALLSKNEVVKPLWFDVDIPTIMDSDNVFDALFYWED